MSWQARRVSTVVALALVAVSTVACSAGDDGAGVTPTEGPSTAPEPAVATQVSFGTVTGRLPGEAKRRLSDQVGAVVDRWMDAAYVAGDYPRSDFGDSWPGFTPGARAEAHRDGDLMSNRDIGAKIDGVEVKKRRLRLDVLAVRKRPVGVTAHVRLRFATTGTPSKDVQVAGRLYLTRGERGWQVFGYDVTKGAAR
jgi:hypothetical protein